MSKKSRNQKLFEAHDARMRETLARLDEPHTRPPSVVHQLIDNTLTIEADGVHARCTCGWQSGARFSGMLASVAFAEHCEGSVVLVTGQRSAP